MAKYLAQLIITGSQVIGRAFVKAVQTEIRASQQAARARSGDGTKANASAANDAITGMTLQEAKLILNVEEINDLQKLEKNYDHLFKSNDRVNGNFLYLQSKVVRAKERIDQELNIGSKTEPESPEKAEKKEN